MMYSLAIRNMFTVTTQQQQQQQQQ
jgi:hypothetical protein